MNGNSSQDIYQPARGISLYFHIPFCTRKCDYCHFFVLPDKESYKIQLLEGFKQEWERWLPLIHNKTLSTIYFGGGTPFLFGPERIGEVLTFIKKDLPFLSNQTEITLEANPENISLEEMQAYRQVGINRVSIGIQTLDNGLLKKLGRLHTSGKALEAVYLTQEAGINNISIDLMYDLPNQTLLEWSATLEGIKNLPITHLSLYNLTIEPHTVFFKNKELIKKEIPNEETSLRIYENAIQSLESFGLKQYEISAFAKPGFHSHHNVGYWTARPFLGLGPSAFSYWDQKRFRNISNLNRYCELLSEGKSPIDFEELLDPEAQLRELFVVQIRLIEGVNLKKFEEFHGKLDHEFKINLSKLALEGFIMEDREHVKLTKKGILFYDTVAAELI